MTSAPQESANAMRSSQASCVHVVDDAQTGDEMELLVDGSDLLLQAASFLRSETVDRTTQGQDLAG